MLICEHIFCIKICSLLQKKVGKKMLCKKTIYFSKEIFFKEDFLFGQIHKKLKTPEKTEQKKKEKNTSNAKKIKGQLKNRKEFLLPKKRWSKTQEEINEVLLSSRKQFFRMRFFQVIFFRKIKDTRRR